MRSRSLAPPTSREAQLIALRAEGLTIKESAARLGITEGTAKIHIGRAAAKNGGNAKALIADWARTQAMDVLRRHSLTLNEWLKRRGEELSPEANGEVTAIIRAMLVDWAQF